MTYIGVHSADWLDEDFGPEDAQPRNLFYPWGQLSQSFQGVWFLTYRHPDNIQPERLALRHVDGPCHAAPETEREKRAAYYAEDDPEYQDRWGLL